MKSNMHPLRNSWPERPLAWLPAMMLAGALSLSMAGPAAADFETAVADYENGNYEAAYGEFEALANAGDERAKPYLERIREKLDASGSASGLATLPDGSQSEARPTDSRPSTFGRAAESPATTSGSDWEAWNPFERRSSQSPAAQPPESYVVAPSHKSFWSTLFHLPGDATVIGLQYVARLLEADNLYWDLQKLSRHSNKIALSVLAGFWWLIIMKAIYGLFQFIRGLIRAMTSPLADKIR